MTTKAPSTAAGPRVPQDLLRAAASARDAVLGRDVGAVLLLRHAGHPADLPVLLDRRRRPRPGPGARRPASSAPTAGWSTCPPSSAPGWPTGSSAPSGRCSTPPSLVMCGHIALSLIPGHHRRRRRPGADRVRQRRGEGQRDVAGRHAVLRRTTRAATPASRSTTSASTSAPSSGRCSPACCRPTSASTGASALAAVGMAIGLTIYAVGRKNLPDERPPHPEPAAAPTGGCLVIGAAVVAVVLIAVLALTGVLSADRLATIVVVHHDRRGDRLLRGDPEQQEDHQDRAPPGVLVHPDVHRQRGVLVAVPAAVHRRHRSTPTSSWTATSSAGRCRSAGCSRSTRCSSSSCPLVFAAIWTKLGRPAAADADQVRGRRRS